MQSRVSFNAGELAPDLALRADIEYYNKGCQCLENWQVSQTGGIRRRKGMRFFASAMSENSILIPYTYSYADDDDARFVVEVNGDKIKVYDFSRELKASFTSGVSIDTEFSYTKTDCRYRQVNALLFITSLSNPPMVLKYDGKEWTLEEFELKHYPWRYVHEQREDSINVDMVGGEISVSFSSALPAIEKPEYAKKIDWLRASYWVEQQEAKSETEKLKQDVTLVDSVPESAAFGQKFAINTEDTIKYWVCTKAWSVSDNFVEGLDSPANYPDNFIAVENESGYDSVTPVYSVKDAAASGKISKGAKLAIKTGYWEYYTCIKPFSDKREGFNAFTDYPGYFIQGITVGDALPCKGEWVFYCSGIWAGCYIIRRNYETSALNGDWEDRGMSFSRNEGLSNTQPSGTEVDEACYLRLFLTKSKRMSDTDFSIGLPPNSTGNRLIVKGYKHDMVLKLSKHSEDFYYWTCVDKVQTSWVASRKVSDWSWAAFSDRYGYPYICETFNKRLVFAATKEQPQTIWLSKVDDINNFMTGSNDDDAIALTMLTTTQNPICWLKARGDSIMLGTSGGEHVIGSGQNAFSAKTAVSRDHGYVGSQRIAVLGTSDKMLYVERGGGRVYSFEYSLEIDGWRSSDISVFAPHIAREHGGLLRASLIRKPDTVAMYVLGDGQLALCTYNSMQEVKAWHRWVTDGEIKEVLGMPNGNANDKVFLIVKRGEEVAIEVVDEDSPYHDQGFEYSSVMLTNALNNVLEAYVTKRHNPVVSAYIGEAFDVKADNLRVCTDGKSWYASQLDDGIVSRGWCKLISPRGWGYEQTVGVKVTGEQDFNLLGLQA